jgi:hypothetical protein
VPVGQRKELALANPREGGFYIALEAEANEKDFAELLSLDGTKESMVFRKDAGGSALAETIRWMASRLSDFECVNTAIDNY